VLRVQVIMKLMEMMDQSSDFVSMLVKKLAPPLVTLLSAEPEIQYVALRNINLVVQKRFAGCLQYHFHQLLIINWTVPLLLTLLLFFHWIVSCLFHGCPLPSRADCFWLVLQYLIYLVLSQVLGKTVKISSHLISLLNHWVKQFCYLSVNLCWVPASWLLN